MSDQKLEDPELASQDFAAEELKAGDVVALRSGGPPMTGRSIQNDEASCEWFTAETFGSWSFRIASLVFYTYTEPIPTAQFRHYDGLECQ